ADKLSGVLGSETPQLIVEHAYNPIHRRYQYDPAGELVRTLDKLRGEIKYEYEANGQLHSRDTGKLVDSEEFRYDAAANRLNFNTSRFDHVKDNRLKQWRDQEYSYDAWGNLIEKRSGLAKWQTFTYDCENRLVRAETMLNSQLHSTGTYQYDSLGRRVGKTSTKDGKTEHKNFLWQGLRMLREESPGQSSLYIYEPGSYAPLARIDQREGDAGNKVYYFHTDQIGTPLEMTDIDGQIVWQATYKAWGSLEALTVNEVEQNLRFQGQYFDEETGLHYNTFRYYDPEVGRFITQDPIGLGGGSNLYSFAPNTYMWLDPLGLTVRYKVNDGLNPMQGNRSTAIDRAWVQEKALITETGRGTRAWSAPEKVLIESTPNKNLTSVMSRAGYTGHHINSVEGNGKLGALWQGDPRNIVFLQNHNHPSGVNEHVHGKQGHRGKTTNSTKGRLIDRAATLKKGTSGC
ncbi:RHS repeat-associated core domain-containing protein, partial [Pseudomonas viridiflava]|uniref:RHS repeat-associated core domain-containing protein n=1 Tax=Pseudomonas viridiflava TaxID=33069 RepID=UPI0018E651B1